jgi:Fuc2NAc and GlcNAc transferase
MASNALGLVLVGALISAPLTGLIRRWAVAHGVLDIPNARSSHSNLTPRGGGIAIVVAATAVVLVLAASGSVSGNMCIALVGGGMTVAVVGFVDDRFALPTLVRLCVHLLAAVWAVYWLGGLATVRVGDHIAPLGGAGGALAVLGIVWVLNLFNFMDGIDGLAASEALFVVGAAALFVAGDSGVRDIASVFAGACAGFLLWNWPPAKIFLGDSGSGYLGYVIAVLALASARYNSGAIWAWLILGGVFFVDATVTLLRRLLRGERVYEAHRTHAYQWLSYRWHSHAKVTLAVMAVNLTWLLPWAVLAAGSPRHAFECLIAGLTPLVLIAIAVGSGRA